MSSSLMMERTGMGMPGVGVPSYGTPTYGAPTAMPPATTSWWMVPRCTFKLEKCTGGFKMTCVCDDKVAAGMVQNLCSMLAGGMCSCCVMLNGMCVCVYNLTMGMCKCEATESGVCITCVSGDSACCEMLQCCCESISCMLEAGCTCCFSMSNTPVCCGTCETPKTGTKGKTSR